LKKADIAANAAPSAAMQIVAVAAAFTDRVFDGGSSGSSLEERCRGLRVF